MAHSDRLKLRLTCTAEVEGDSKLEVTKAPSTNAVIFPVICANMILYLVNVQVQC